MGQGVVGALLAALAAASVENLNAQIVQGSVRPEDPAVRALIARGLERSETFRTLVSRLDNTDIVVYVRFSPCRGSVPACVLWASTRSAARRLLIRIDRFDRSEDDLTALLAHELQHALEVASASGITDLVSFQEWFGTHGRSGPGGFETDKATEVMRKVMAELRCRRCSKRPRKPE